MSSFVQHSSFPNNLLQDTKEHNSLPIQQAASASELAINLIKEVRS